jgi:hypothetical protein
MGLSEPSQFLLPIRMARPVFQVHRTISIVWLGSAQASSAEGLQAKKSCLGEVRTGGVRQNRRFLPLQAEKVLWFR